MNPFILNLNKFLANRTLLLCYFALVHIVPNIFLLFTEPLNWIAKILLISIPLGVYLIIFSLWKKIGILQLLLFPMMVFHSFQMVVFYLFGEDVIAVDMFLNVITTNASEAGELLNGLWPAIIFVCLMYIPAIIIAIILVRRKVYLSGKTRRRTAFVGLSLCLISFALSFAAKDTNTNTFKVAEDIYPANIFYNLNYASKKWKRSRNYPETSKDFTYKATKDKTVKQREIYVLVIGETSRAENWGLYGYERPTTPNLSKDSSLVYFKDALTQSNTTHKSVPLMLSPASAENYNAIYEEKSIIEAFKEVGFKTVFLSNQSANHNFTDFFASEADYVEYFRFVDRPDNKHDMDMLPAFNYYIDEYPDDDLFIIVHSYGSHFNYKERYPQEYAVYQPDNVVRVSRKERETLINAYDNTILYTDKFLRQVMDELLKSEAISTVFYTSDHGEDILDDDRNRFLHASPNPTFYQLRIPMFVWFSPMYRETHPNRFEFAQQNQEKGVNTRSVFHTLLNLADIETSYRDESLSLVSDKFEERPRMYLNDHDKPIPFTKANLKDEDREMIKKRNVSTK